MLGLRRSRKLAPAPHEESAPHPDFDWSQLLDGRLRRLKRGRHFTGSAPAVLHEAQLAADDHGKKALTFHDQIGKFEYVWVQFIDGRSPVGEPCAVCGGNRLRRTQEFFLSCLSCGRLQQIDDRRPSTSAAEFLGCRLLSLEGEEIDCVLNSGVAVIEATCHFSRPVAEARLNVTFLEDRRKVLRTGSPHAVEVPRADTIRAMLHLDARVLSPGEYRVRPSVEVVLDERDRRLHSISHRGSLAIRVVADPVSAGDPGGAARSSLHWEVTSSNDQPMPIVSMGGVTDDIDGEVAGDS